MQNWKSFRSSWESVVGRFGGERQGTRWTRILLSLLITCFGIKFCSRICPSIEVCYFLLSIWHALHQTQAFLDGSAFLRWKWPINSIFGSYQYSGLSFHSSYFLYWHRDRMVPTQTPIQTIQSLHIANHLMIRQGSHNLIGTLSCTPTPCLQNPKVWNRQPALRYKWA